MRTILAALIAGILIGIAMNPLRGWTRVPEWWKRDALCVHNHEGSWSDPNGPYWGGMQLDMAFMRKYGGWILNHHGTADHWSPATQLLVAYRGWKRQGWGAWPNTSRMCGLA